jgi:restriction system protein
MPKRRYSTRKPKNPRLLIAFYSLKFGVLLGCIGVILKIVRQSSLASSAFTLSMLLIAFGTLLFLYQLGSKAVDKPSASNHDFARAPIPSSYGSQASAAERNLAATTAAIPTAPTQWSAEVFHLIEWRRFEALVEALFQQSGFRTESQSHGADEGVDIWLYLDSHGPKAVDLVQCKHWQSKRVGVDKVRELAGVLANKKISRGRFVTSSTFTPEAIRFAEESNVINLIDATTLLDLITSRIPEQQSALLNVALEGDYWRPTCVNCGVKMVSRTPKKGGANFWGCAAYPKCKNMMNMTLVPH